MTGKAAVLTDIDNLQRKLDEALERQAATSEILGAISQSPTNVQPVFDAIVQTAVRLIRCDIAFVLRCDGATFSPAAAAGRDGPLPDLGPSHLPIDPDANFPSRAIVGKKNVHLPDWSLIGLPEHERQIQALIGVNSALFLPLLRETECIGVLALAGKQANIFGDSEIALAESFRDQALIAIENVRLFNETREALEQQTATAEVLSVISSSAGDLAPVFDAMLGKAMQLCGANFGVLNTFDGEGFHTAATYGLPPAYDEYRRKQPLYYGPDTAPSRLLHGEPLVEIQDLLDSNSYRAGEPNRRALVDFGKARSLLAVPLLKDERVVGNVMIFRQDPGRFSGRQIALLKQFAAQAVIRLRTRDCFANCAPALRT